MRLFHVTDFHFRRDWFAWAKVQSRQFDLLCFSGDFLDLFGKVQPGRQIDWVTAWAGELSGKLVWVAGNHDTDLPEPNLRGWTSGLPTPALPCSPTISLAGWGVVPANVGDVDIVLSHAPPAGLATATEATGGDQGDFDLAEAIRQAPPGTLVLSGHVHSPVGWHASAGGSLSVNPGVNPNSAVPNYVDIDTSARRAAWFARGELREIVRY